MKKVYMFIIIFLIIRLIRMSKQTKDVNIIIPQFNKKLEGYCVYSC